MKRGTKEAPKNIVVDKPAIYPKGTFTNLGFEELDQACKYLSFNEQRLFLYLMQKGGYSIFAIYPNEVKKAIGLNRNMYREAFEGLIDKGYIEESCEGYVIHSYVDFVDSPEVVKERCRKKKRKKEIEDDDIEEYEI